jgi:hypothetical protein
MDKKPTRRELLAVVTECQNLFGEIMAAFSDTNPNRADDITRLTDQGFNLCLKARSFDPP